MDLLSSLLKKFSNEIFEDLQPHIIAKFKRFHSENPHIYALFKRFCLDLKQAGQTQYGSKAVMERIRWHVLVETRGEDFKINNNYTRCYTRLLILDEPEFSDFFQTRKSPGTVPGTHLTPLNQPETL
jgi:hypothetical protein